MNPQIYQLLSQAKAELDTLDPWPWDNLSPWIARVRPLILSGCREHLDQFDEVTRDPGWATIAVSTYSRWETPDQRVRRQSEQALREQRQAGQAHRQKAQVLAFLQGILSIPAELFGPATKGTPGVTYNTTITNSTVGAVAAGHGASAHGSVTQAEHRRAIGEVQKALIDDQDSLDADIQAALFQFLKIARDIQVEQKNMGEIQMMMKDALDEVWAKQLAEGLRSQALPKTLSVITALSKIPVMVEVVEKLIGG